MRYIVILLMGLSTGCKCFQCEEPDFKPLPPPTIIPELAPDNFLRPCTEEEHLLMLYPNIAYKSITQDDYIIKEDC